MNVEQEKRISKIILLKNKEIDQIKKIFADKQEINARNINLIRRLQYNIDALKEHFDKERKQFIDQIKQLIQEPQSATIYTLQQEVNDLKNINKIQASTIEALRKDIILSQI